MPASARSDFAVIVPAFNEAPVMHDLVRELRAAFERHGLDGDVILVDDGSTDGTGDVAEKAANGWSRFRVIRHRTNRGKTEAMVTAADATERGTLVLFDADLQHSPDDIPRFLDKLAEGWDIVAGRKVGSYDKRVVSSLYNRLSRTIFDVPVSDLNSMKAFRRTVLDGLLLRHDWHRFFVVLAHARGASVAEIDVELHPRRAGESKFRGPFRILVGLVDLVSVWFLLLFSRKPLLLFGGTGLALAALGVLVAFVTIYLRFVHPMIGFDPYIPPMGYRPLLYLVMLLETLGFLLLGFGLVSEQVAEVRDELEAIRKQGR
ncbi:MAG: glycosyltransferase [Gemmatimonadetes bacterium]|nr:glycosyltransferase [Gemmatimonadota bacterium]